MEKRVKILFMTASSSFRRIPHILKNIDLNKFVPSLALFEKSGPFINEIPAGVPIYSLGKQVNFTKLIVKLSRIIRQKGIEIVVSFLWYSNVISVLACRLSFARVKSIINECCYTNLNIKSKSLSKIRNELIKRIYPLADTVIAISEGVKEGLIKDYGIPGKKIRIIYNPSDIEGIRTLAQEKVDHPWFNEQIPTIVAVGRLTAQKDYPLLLNAFTQVQKEEFARLLILGEGEERQNLERLIQKLKIDDRVALLGYRKNPFKYMARSTLFVLSSLWEGFANVIVEAMACGVPVIATRCPSGPEEIITNGVNGILVPPGNVGVLAEAILRLMKNEVLRDKLARAGKRRAQDFRIERIITEYENLFENIL